MDESIGYATIASMKYTDVTEIISAFKNTKALIIDIRNYPFEYTIIDSYFVSKSTPYAKFTIGNIDNPGEFKFCLTNTITNSAESYKGKLIVIVNEITQSWAETLTMAFRAGLNTTIIGSATAGANGNVSNINLPGGLQTRISGIGVYYPNGKETQRVGNVPDVWVEPTIEGIREGRDELLEKAVALINEEK